MCLSIFVAVYNRHIYNPGRKSLGQYCNILQITNSANSTNSTNFLAVLPPLPYTKLKLGKNSGYTGPALFVGRGEGLSLCENAPETQKCPKGFVHDCSFCKERFSMNSLFGSNII